MDRVQVDMVVDMVDTEDKAQRRMDKDIITTTVLEIMVSSTLFSTITWTHPAHKAIMVVAT
jgi:uncharacterized protein (DUF39 family)